MERKWAIATCTWLLTARGKRRDQLAPLGLVQAIGVDERAQPHVGVGTGTEG
jgi:hypothetical protein